MSDMQNRNARPALRPPLKSSSSARRIEWFPILLAILAGCFSALGQGERAHIKPSDQPGRVEVRVDSRNDRYYHLEAATNLTDWRGIAGAGGTGTNLSFAIQTGEQEIGFFRFVVEDNGTLRSVSNLLLQAESGFGEGNLRSLLLLSSNGVQNTDDLFNRFRSVNRVNQEVARLQEAGLKIDAGNVVSLLREAELRTNLKPLEAQGFRPGLTDALVKSRLDMSELHRLMRRLPADQGSLMGRDAYIEFKNTLNEAGDVQVSLSEFHQLRAYVSGLQPVADLRLFQSHQSTPFGTTNTEPAALAEERLLKTPPPSYGYVPEYARKLSQARLMVQSYPLTILGYRLDRSGPVPVPVEIGPLPPFTEESATTGYRKFIVNESGLAWFRVYGHAQGGRLMVRNSAGIVLLDQQIPANTSRGFILPIFKEDECAAFEVLKDPGLTLTLVNLQKPVVLDNAGGQFSLDDHLLPAVLPSMPAGAAWLRFPLLQQGGNGQVLQPSVIVRNAILTNTAYQAMLVSSGFAASAINVPVNQLTALESSSDNGLFNLFVLPKGLNGAPLFSFDPETRKVSSLALFELNSTDDPGESILTFSLNYQPIQTRLFVLGKLNKAAYSHDGEEGSFGEVKLSLHANIAPFFEQSARFGNVFAENLGFDAWRKWMDNGKKSAGLLGDPQFLSGLETIRQSEDFMNELGAIFMMPGSQYSLANPDDLLTIYTLYVKSQLGKSWYGNIENAQALYDAWAGEVVQINAFKYPFGQKYKISDFSWSGWQAGGSSLPFPMHPVIPIDMPTFAMPKDRMAHESMPISFDYATWEEDELDKSDLVGAALKGVVNTGLAILGQNWAQAVCSGVDMVDEMHKTVEAAKDDPIGSANFRLNRASSRHGFYGLEDDQMKAVNISGKPKKNSVNAFENGLNYAKIICDTMSAVSSIQSQVSTMKNNLTLAWDIFSTGNLADVETLKSVLLMAAGQDASKVALIEDFISKLKSGQLSEQFEVAVMLAQLSQDITQGTDLYDSFSGLAADLESMSGMGSLGFNMVHSECYFHFNGYGDRKTTANSTIGIVRSVPAQSISVVLDKVSVFDIKEEALGLPAEIFINTRVGVIADTAPVSWQKVNLQFTDENNSLILNNGSKGYLTCPNIPYTAYAKRTFPKREFVVPGDYAPWSSIDNTMLDAAWAPGANAAAIYVEIGTYENDGDNIDDDMIGVYSRTFLLEEILKSPGVEWQQVDATHWRLDVKNYPVYDAPNLETVVEVPEGAYREAQLAHNRDRLSHPSALVDFHITLQLGAFSQWNDTNDYNISPVDTTKSLTNINLKVIAAGTEPALQIMDLKGNRALVQLETTNQYERIGVFEISPSSPAPLQQYGTLPAVGMPPEVQNWFHKTNFLWAQFARGGAFVVVAHTGGLAAFNLANPSSLTSTSLVFPEPMYPSRLAVDEDQQTIYLSFRRTGFDLGIYRLNADGTFSTVGTKNDINHTIAGLIPAKGGGVIIHAISGIRNDSHGYKRYALNPEDTYFSDAEDLQDEGGDRFGNSNTLLKYSWVNSELAPRSIVELAGELSETQMRNVCLRNQSSMFTQFDARTLLSKSHSPFAISLDSAGMFENPAWINSKDSLFNKYWVTDLRGLDAGDCYIASRINSRMNESFLRAYLTNDAALSPFNAFTRREGPLTCPDNFLVSPDLFLHATNGTAFILTRGRTTDYKTSEDVSDAAPLVLVDLHYVPVRELAPAYSAVMQLPAPTTVGAFAFIGDETRVTVGASDTSVGGNDLYSINLSTPATPVIQANFGGEMYSTPDLLYVESKKLLFAINPSSGTIDVYRMQNPAAPVLATNLPGSARSLAWSEKRSQLYATAQGSILVFTLDSNGQFHPYTENISGAGAIKKIAYNDSLDLAIASVEPSWNYIGTHELLVLNFQNAAQTNLSSGRVTLSGRWVHPEVGSYTSVNDVALSTDGTRGYVVIRNNNRYMDLYLFNLSNQSAPVAVNSVYNTTSMTPLIGGIALSPDGRYLACTRGGLDVFDLQAQQPGSLSVTAHLDDPEVFYPPYGPVEFSPSGDHVLTARAGYNYHTLLIRLFR